MAHLSSPMDWEPTWQPPLPGRFITHERDQLDCVPPMPGAFVDTPPRRSEAGLGSVGFQPRNRKRTAGCAQFEDQPQYVEESAGVSGTQPIKHTTMKLRFIISAVCWFAGVTWDTVQWPFRKARRVQVTEIRRAAADGFISIKRRATEVLRPSAPTAEQIIHQRRAQASPPESPQQLSRDPRRTRHERPRLPASAQLRSRKSSKKLTVPQNTIDAQLTAPLSPPGSPSMADMPILDTQDPTMEQSARVDEIPAEETYAEMMNRARIREEEHLEKLRIEELNRPKSLDEMIAWEYAKKNSQTHDETMALKKARKQEEDEKVQKMARELARKKAAGIKAQQEAKQAELRVQEMTQSTQRAMQAKTKARQAVRLVSPNTSEDEAEYESEQEAEDDMDTPQRLARMISKRQAIGRQKLAEKPIRSILKHNRQQKAEDEVEPAQRLAQILSERRAIRAQKLAEKPIRPILKHNCQQEAQEPLPSVQASILPSEEGQRTEDETLPSVQASILHSEEGQKAQDEALPSVQAPAPPSKEGQKARDESYIDYFLLPEVYEEAKVLEARIEGGLKNLALESSSEHIDWKTEEDKRRQKAFDDYTRMAAEELAKAQAEAENLAKELAEEEAAREPHTGRRRLQTKLVQLSDEWQIKIDQAMIKGENVTLATALDGTQLTKRDLITVLGQQAWLNDNIINAYVDIVVEHANKKAGRNQRDKTPKVVAQSSFFYKKIRDDGPQSVSRWMRRKRAAGKNLLEVETMLIPVNNSAHWTMIVVSPKARTIEYLDSFGGSKDVFIRNTKAWLAVELGSAWKEDDWRVLDTKSASQYNGYDCGVFAVTNAECVAGGVTTTSYDGDDMTMQRRRIAAVLLNGGFTGDLEAAEDVDMSGSGVESSPGGGV